MIIGRFPLHETFTMTASFYEYDRLIRCMNNGEAYRSMGLLLRVQSITLDFDKSFDDCPLVCEVSMWEDVTMSRSMSQGPETPSGRTEV